MTEANYSKNYGNIEVLWYICNFYKICFFFSEKNRNILYLTPLEKSTKSAGSLKFLLRTIT